MDTDTAFAEGQSVTLTTYEDVEIPATFVRYLAGSKLAVVHVEYRYGDRVETDERFVGVSRLAARA